MGVGVGSFDYSRLLVISTQTKSKPIGTGFKAAKHIKKKFKVSCKILKNENFINLPMVSILFLRLERWKRGFHLAREYTAIKTGVRTVNLILALKITLLLYSWNFLNILTSTHRNNGMERVPKLRKYQ